MRTTSSPGVENGWHGGQMNLPSYYPIDKPPFVDDRFHAIMLGRP